ncbi:hypothetical protein [Nonomuraea sediminis]|nr:hypothetical protein [Nonomuraea sediminis]
MLTRGGGLGARDEAATESGLAAVKGSLNALPAVKDRLFAT